jgi:hypothetical protein
MKHVMTLTREFLGDIPWSLVSWLTGCDREPLLAAYGPDDPVATQAWIRAHKHCSECNGEITDGEPRLVLSLTERGFKMLFLCGGCRGVCVAHGWQWMANCIKEDAAVLWPAGQPRVDLYKTIRRVN